MNIVSYRGPGKAGGVSPALNLIMDSKEHDHRWWFHDGNGIRCTADGAAGTVALLNKVSEEIVDGHYRYCNEFLWPVMHGLCQYASYSQADRALYERFNRIFATEILRNSSHTKHFVQDYQLAAVAQDLNRRSRSAAGVFWHIPWPKEVPERFLAPVTDLARALLSAKIFGFHKQEYAYNFLDFVKQHVAGMYCNYDSLTIERDESWHVVKPYVRPYFNHSTRQASSESKQTQLVVAPLGIDVDYWQSLSLRRLSVSQGDLAKTPYVLSVDRADYTKGITDRLKAIDHFFDSQPTLKGKITFAQICVRTRESIEAYNKYWTECEQQTALVNEKHSLAGWKPVLNIAGPLNCSQLAPIYRDAAVMLVCPLRDGLNLTAKEFVACQTGDPGVLALTRTAGVWDELGGSAVEVEPANPIQMSNAIYQALTMPLAERSFRRYEMLEKLRGNTLIDWCDTFVELLQGAAEPTVKVRKEIS